MLTMPVALFRMQLRRGLVALLMFLLVAVSVQDAQSARTSPGTAGNLRDWVKRNGFNLFLQMADIAGLHPKNPNSTFTVLAPTDEAVKAWLAKMNLTMAELTARPGLAAAVVAYHVLPRIRANKTAVTSVKPLPTKSNPIIGITADNVYPLRFYLENNKVVLENVQGNTAHVVKPDINAGHSIIHGIDRVMLSGDVYLTVTDFLKSHPDFDTMRAKLEQTGLIQDMGLRNTAVTVFAPTDAAFAAANAYLSKLTSNQLRSVLRYHILPGERTLPADFKPGQAYGTTLQGHNITLLYKQVTRSGVTGLNISVVPEYGLAGANHNDAHVSLANFYAKKTTIHGIDAVLLPNIGLPPTTQTAQTLKNKITQKITARGRHLLQRFSRDTVGGMTLNSVSMTNTQSAIRAAAAGQVSAADAAATGLHSSELTALRCFNCEAQGQAWGWSGR